MGQQKFLDLRGRTFTILLQFLRQLKTTNKISDNVVLSSGKLGYPQAACFIYILTAFLIAGIGPDPMIAGSTPAWPHETILARGATPLF